jgi:hypothetical protein
MPSTLIRSSLILFLMLAFCVSHQVGTKFAQTTPCPEQVGDGWAQGATVKVYIDSGITDSNIRTQMTDAIMGWDDFSRNSAAGVKFEIVSSPSQANLKIEFGSTPAGAPGQLTNRTFDGDGHLTSAIIKIDTNHTTAIEGLSYNPERAGYDVRANLTGPRANALMMVEANAPPVLLS